MYTMRRGKLLKQLRIGTQSMQAPRKRGIWEIEVGLPTLFLIQNLKGGSAMYQKVSTNLNFVEREKKTEQFWKENRIF